MAVNPQIIAPQVQGIQLENPMTFARNALAMREAQSQIAANQLKVARAQKAANVLAANRGKSIDEIANALLGEGLADEAENVMKFGTARGQATKAAREAEAASLAILGSDAGAFLDNPALLNKATITPWAASMVQRGLLTPDALQRFNDLPDDPVQIGSAMRRLQVQALTPAQQTETSVLQQDLGGTTRVLRVPKLGGKGEVVPGTEATVTASPNRQGITILTPSETARGKKVGELGGEALVQDYNAARAAVTGLGKDYQVLQLLKEGKPTTGITAELETNIDRLVSTFAGDREAASRASDSELLEALLGQDVFQQFQSLGVGARGLDTPGEREFLREVISGRKTLNKETLVQMAEMRAKYKEQAIDSYNERVRSGELDEFFRDFGRPKREFKKPERPKFTDRPVSVTTPTGQTYTFPNQAAADKFRKDAGL
jgi:hypothetical protein